MLFYPQSDLVLVNVRKGEKEGNKWAMVTLADPETYENMTFSLARDHMTDHLQPKTRYKVMLEAQQGRAGNFFSATLVASDGKK
ncbi:MAG: hypothetical protein FWB87_08685 [Defluviitaleaceae bacterium]|nr:hypothetical protein [Defluviitaleaceae bacterium]